MGWSDDPRERQRGLLPDTSWRTRGMVKDPPLTSRSSTDPLPDSYTPHPPVPPLPFGDTPSSFNLDFRPVLLLLI
eukprot:756994-Hanusia_phi.AAC.1